MERVPNLDNMYGPFLVDLVFFISISPCSTRFGAAYISVIIAAM